MNQLSRVVWSEGMHLGPHQFQVQARCFEDSLHFASSALLPFAHGFTGLQIDAEALLNGTVSVVHARGILPDGTPFQIPECDAPPPARPVAELFPPVADALTVWLCLPVRRIPQDAAAPDALPARHRAEAALVPDENTGRDERSVTLAKKRFELLLDMESRDGFTALPLARVRRDGAGHFLYDAEFVPPSLDVSASEPLMRLTRRAIELLEAKSQTLSQGAAGASAPGVSSHAPARFWLLHAVNSALPPLRHLLLARRGHPELLFLELSRLAGALCTFTLNSDVAKLPAWDHDNPGPVFLALYEHIRLHLETVLPTSCLQIPLRPTARYFHAGEISDTRCFGRSNWIFGIRAAAGQADLMTRTPQLVKICSAKFVGDLVRRAMAGLPLRHLPSPPPALPAKVETQYFLISKEGPFWDNIVQTRALGIYVPGDLPDAEIEVYVVLDV